MKTKMLAVHDAVRCCLMGEWLDKLFAKAGQTGAALTGCGRNEIYP